MCKFFIALRLNYTQNLQVPMKKMFVAIMAVAAISFTSCADNAAEQEAKDAQEEADQKTDELMDEMEEDADYMEAETDTLGTGVDTLSEGM